MRPNILAITSALLLAGAPPALAQRVDVGGAASTFHVGYGNGTFVGAGPLVTVHFTDKHSVQLVTDLRYQHTANSVGFNGIYSVQYRRTFKRAASSTAFFLTAGAVGGGGWHRIEGFTYIDAGHYENGKWVAGTMEGTDYRAMNRFSLTPPWVPVAGAGIERDITPRVALRADVTGAFGPYGALGVRASAGAIVKLGRGRK